MKISAKLFLFFMICIASFAVISIVLNAVFLESFYIYRNMDILISIGNSIETEYGKDQESIQEYLKQIDRTESLNCIIAGNDFQIKFSSFPLQRGEGSTRLPSEIDQLIKGKEGQLKGSDIYTIIETPDYGIREIAYITELQGGDYLIIRKPLSSIAQSSDIANQFLLYTGLIILAVGCIIIYIFSKKITRPVIEMDSVAKGISELDFSKRLKVKSTDEIGNLAKSMNDIADKLSASIKTLQEDVKRRKLLVRSLSHELKTPIGVIKGYAEGLKFGVASDPEKSKKYCEVIAAECDRIDEMIKELLDLSKLESGIFNINPAVFNLFDLINETVEHFSQESAKRGENIELKCNSLLTVNADRELIEKVLRNYISNAVKYADGEKRIVVSTEEHNDKVRISFFNTGRQIPADDREKIWDIFYMSDKARARESGGHGLGLSIVKSIAELINAGYGYENTGDGVIFFFEFKK